MRSIPFQVIVVMGLSDGKFPSRSLQETFDLMAQKPKKGDRNRSQDDRFLLLEALLAARQRLVITYQGLNLKDLSVLPPSVMVDELLKVVESMTCDPNLPADQRRQAVEAWLLQKHPLQAHHPANFDPQGKIPSYDHYQHQAAEAALGVRQKPQPLLVQRLPSPETSPLLGLDHLTRFWQSPLHHLASQSLHLGLPRPEEKLEEWETNRVESLLAHQLGNLALKELLAGKSAEDLLAWFAATGQLPPGDWGQAQGRALLQQASLFVQQAQQLPPVLQPSQEVESQDLQPRLFGKLEGRGAQGLVQMRFQRPRAKLLLRFWLQHLLACHAFSDCQESWLLSRATSGPGLNLLSCHRPPEPTRLLQGLLELFQQGSGQGLAFFPESSLAYAQAMKKSGERDMALKAARQTWLGSKFAQGEGDDFMLRRLLGKDYLPGGPTPWRGGPSFEDLACQIWWPFLEAKSSGGQA